LKINQVDESENRIGFASSIVHGGFYPRDGATYGRDAVGLLLAQY